MQGGRGGRQAGQVVTRPRSPPRSSGRQKRGTRSHEPSGAARLRKWKPLLGDDAHYQLLSTGASSPKGTAVAGSGKPRYAIPLPALREPCLPACPPACLPGQRASKLRTGGNEGKRANAGGGRAGPTLMAATFVLPRPCALSCRRPARGAFLACAPRV